MTEDDEKKSVNEISTVPSSSVTPLVFISHDSRDAELAEAFSKLLKSVSAGMIKTFRSSDKKGNDGIDFGDEWYKRLMTKLQSTSEVVCLFTERSLDRPWILFEAGVAKGRVATPVVGLALGVPLSRVSSGPFYNFHNMDDSEDELTKLVHQLARRIPNLELDADVVRAQVQSFKAAEFAILETLSPAGDKKIDDSAEENSVAKLAEEMKALPARVAERLLETGDPFRRRRSRRFNPFIFEEIMQGAGKPGDPVGILMAASLVRDELPWLYELTMEVYRAVKTGNADAIEIEMQRFRDFSKLMRGSLMHEMGFVDKDSHMLAIELPRILENLLERSVANSTFEPRSTEKRPLKGDRTVG